MNVRALARTPPWCSTTCQPHVDHGNTRYRLIGKLWSSGGVAPGCVDRRNDLCRLADAGLNPLAEGHREFVQHLQVGRIHKRHEQQAVVELPNRDGGVPASEFLG